MQLEDYGCELERNGFGVVTAKNREEAIAKFIEETPEIAIVDYDLPKSGGHEVLVKILTLRPETKLIMLTTRGDDVERAERIGLELFLLKPVSSQILVKSALVLSNTRARPRLMVVTR